MGDAVSEEGWGVGGEAEEHSLGGESAGVSGAGGQASPPGS